MDHLAAADIDALVVVDPGAVLATVEEEQITGNELKLERRRGDSHRSSARIGQLEVGEVRQADPASRPARRSATSSRTLPPSGSSSVLVESQRATLSLREVSLSDSTVTTGQHD